MTKSKKATKTPSSEQLGPWRRSRVQSFGSFEQANAAREAYASEFSRTLNLSTPRTKIRIKARAKDARANGAAFELIVWERTEQNS